MHEPRQTTDSLLMIRPARCGYNPETEASNSFQKRIENLSDEEIWARARAEFDRFVEVLRRNEMNVFVVEDTPEPVKPDAVFPNNWISFHADGTVFLYPLMSEARNRERRRDIIETLKNHFQISNVVDLADGENAVLEGTGSMVLDRANRTIYACLSPRTDKNLLEKYAAKIGYKPLSFICLDAEGAPVYHTNVVMCVGEKLAIVCLNSIKNAEERSAVAKNLIKTNHEIVEISFDQMNRFAGNMLEVRNRKGKSFLLMSASARKSLTGKQIEQIEKHAEILSSEIETIEEVGGGSARCMLAEIFCEKNID